MARLMSALLVAVFMVASLSTVVVRPTLSTGCLDAIRGKSKPSIDQLEAKPVDELSYAESKILVKNYAKKLPEESTVEMDSSEQEQVFEKLVSVLNHETSLDLKKSGVPKCWRGLLSLWRTSGKCDKSFVKNFFEYAKGNRDTGLSFSLNSALDSFRAYLENCDYEDYYKEALTSIKQLAQPRWPSDMYPTLNSYFRQKLVWGRGSDLDALKDEVEKRLMIISNLRRIEGIPSEAGCDYFKNDLVSSLYDDISSDPINRLERDYFELALGKSGLEERFKTVMTRHGADPEDPSLASYLYRRYHHKGQEDKMKYALYMVDKLASRENNDPLDGCAIDLEPMEYVELNLESSVADSFADIVRAERFKEVVTMKVDKDSWAFVKKFANLMERKFMPKYRDDPRPSRVIIMDILDDVVEEIDEGKWKETVFDFKTNDFRQSLWRNSMVLLKQVDDDMIAMKYDFATATKDSEMMNLMNYLGYCSLLPYRSKSYQVLEKLGAPYYDTKADLFTHKRLENFKW